MSKRESQYGYWEGEACGREQEDFSKCDGVVALHPKEGSCSCHVSPPCSACTDQKAYCPKCGYESADDVQINNHIVNVDKATQVYKHYELRPLDSTKIDWHSKSHTSSTMIKEGVYPEGTTMEQVLDRIGRGTFGGRFEYFGSGHFKYIAYTD